MYLLLQMLSIATPDLHVLSMLPPDAQDHGATAPFRSSNKKVLEY
jgi:hypothetical protein